MADGALNEDIVLCTTDLGLALLWEDHCAMCMPIIRLPLVSELAQASARVCHAR
jgi:hypothetical protein